MLTGLALVALLLAAGCSSSTATRTTSPSEIGLADPGSTLPPDLGAAGATVPLATDDPTPPPADWRPCDGGLDCATLTVPLDYGDPGLGRVDLALVRRRASDPTGRIGSLVVNPGGPGGSGVQMVRDGYGTGNKLNDRFDIVSWDPRGVGSSTPLTCGSSADAFVALDRLPDAPAAEAALDASAAAVARDCGAHGRPLLDHIDTMTTTRDLEQLRRSLGEDQLSYVGYSYGTAIGLAYLEHYPERVRALVLDGVVQPDWNLEQSLGAQASGFDKAVDTTFDQCDSQPTCPVRDARATYDRVSARLVRDPIPLGGGATFGPTDLAVSAISSAYSPDRGAVFLEGLADADAGDPSRLQDLVNRYRTAVGSYVTYAAVVCADLPHPQGADAYRALAARLATRSDRFGAVVANEMLPCAFWPTPTTGQPHPVAVSGGPAVLVVGTTGDPATPYSSAQSVAAALSSSVLLTDDGQGHTSGGRSACVDAAVRHYLVDLIPPATGARCTNGS
jgi:pimeloyl-ACP methyl ester carboxylesterase